MNPWIILAGLLLAISLYGGGYYKGHHAGVNEQKVENQKDLKAANDRTQGIIDGYELQRDRQTAEANARYRKSQLDVIAALVERDAFKTRLGEEHVKNQTLTNRLGDAYAAYGLRFTVPAEDARPWCGSGPAEGSGKDGAGHAATATVQLPDPIARDLRKLAKDADELNDDYKLCYGYAKPVEQEALLE